MTTYNLKNKISTNVDAGYFLRFLIMLLILYYGNLFYIAITDTNGKLYSQFLDEHLNYINWLRNSYLFTSVQLSALFGVEAHITPPHWITAKSGAYLEMVYECLGINFFSFWTAFVWANKNPLQTKLKWWLIGMLSIWFINCVRVSLLLVALVKQWQYNRFMDHHTLFNLVAYALIAIFIYFYIKDVGTKTQLVT